MVKRYESRVEWKGFIFVAPAVVFSLLVVIYPLFKVFQYSFYEYSRHASFIFAGFSQYRRLFSDQLFWTSIKNTFIFTIGTIALDLALSWAIALLLNAKWPHLKVRNFFRGALLLPFLFSAPASALLWGILYQPLGFLNYINEKIFGATINFLGDPGYALFSVLWVNVWKNFPLIMILILGGLQSIPPAIYESARIDGANRIQSFWYITLPQMRSLMMTIIIIDFATTFIHFDLVWTMTKGGPLRSTYLISFFLYQRGMQAFKFGYASAIGVVTALIISACIGIYIFLCSKRVDTLV